MSIRSNSDQPQDELFRSRFENMIEKMMLQICFDILFITNIFQGFTSCVMANIVHFGKYYFPDTGGIESVTQCFAQGAAEAGHNVSVVCFGKDPISKEEVINSVHIFRKPADKSVASQPLGFRYVTKCFMAAKDADLVHFHAPNMLGAICAIFIPAKTRLLVHWHSDVIDKGLLGKILRPLERALLRRADTIVATSQVYADFSKALAPFKNKVSVVPIGVEDAKHLDDNFDLPNALEERIANRRIILSIGRLVPYKGFDVLIKAAQYFTKDSVVVIVGGGALQVELERAIERADIKDRVLLAGRLSDAYLHALLKRATLYCLPSTCRAEAFGVVLLEAMACGLPIVASDIPGSGVPWVNRHGLSGLNVPVGDVHALANACNRIISSEQLRRRLSRGARQRFLSEFTKEISVKRMMATYERLLGE